MEKILRVVGQEKIKESPDYTVLKLGFKRVRYSYENALEETKINTEGVTSIVKQLELDNVVLKTKYFKINRNYDYDVKRYDGYQYNQEIEVCFDRNNSILDEILKKVLQMHIAPEVNVSYKIKDPSKIKDELIKKCVIDAKNKAKVIADASNIKLGNIIRIDYSDDEPICEMRMMTQAPDDDLIPEDIEFSDSITLEYEIL